VGGITCIKPRAPERETAMGSNPLSWWIIAKTRHAGLARPAEVGEGLAQQANRRSPLAAARREQGAQRLRRRPGSTDRVDLGHGEDVERDVAQPARALERRILGPRLPRRRGGRGRSRERRSVAETGQGVPAIEVGGVGGGDLAVLRLGAGVVTQLLEGAG
jgi:hypothetical protein